MGFYWLGWSPPRLFLNCFDLNFMSEVFYFLLELSDFLVYHFLSPPQRIILLLQFNILLILHWPELDRLSLHAPHLHVHCFIFLPELLYFPQQSLFILYPFGVTLP